MALWTVLSAERPVFHRHYREGNRRVIKICQGRDGNGAKRIVFSLPADEPPGRVSVVGSFNDWTPGQHHLQPRTTGRRSATVEVAAGVAVRFRYLGENGNWFDDPDDPGVLDPGGDA